MAIHLGRSSPSASRDRPERRRESSPGTARAGPAAPTWSCSRWGFPCRRHCWRRGALLPHHFTLAALPGKRLAVCFLWHYPWGCPRRPLTGTVPPWSPDFPLPLPKHRKRPSDRLAWDDMGRSAPVSKSVAAAATDSIAARRPSPAAGGSRCGPPAARRGASPRRSAVIAEGHRGAIAVSAAPRSIKPTNRRTAAALSRRR